MESKKITAIYCRTATPDATAIEAQRETLLRFAAAQGFGDTELFEDDGCNGINDVRPAFARMNADIAAGRVARVLARSVSRLGRNTTEVLEWARAAQAQGAEVLTLDMGRNPLPKVYEALMAAPEATLPERFAAWLSLPQAGPFTFQEGSYHCTLFRAAKNPGFDYLYCQRHYHCGGIQRGDNFEYAGIYCKGDGLVYDGQYEIRALGETPDSMTSLGADELLKRLGAEVRGAVEAAIGNDPKNLRVQLLTTQRDLDNMQYFLEHSAAAKARELFLRGAEGWDSYRCQYIPPHWTEDTLLDYITDPAGYAACEAQAYVNGNQDAILVAFLENSAVAKEYAALTGNPRHPAHRLKRIMEAMRTTPAKTVRVTICKDDVDFSFKTEADEFRRDCGSHYWTHNIAAADRREFERLFGRHADYGPEDILRIEYGHAVLYEAQEV